MKSISRKKEVFTLIVLVIITIALFILGNVVFSNTHYSSALLGMSGASIGLSLFQLKRMIDFIKNPDSYKKEQINKKDERNNMLVTYAKSTSYDLETFIIFGITLYAIYINSVEFVLAIFILWIIRIASFFVYLYRNNNRF